MKSPAVKGLVLGWFYIKAKQQANSQDILQRGRGGVILQPLSASRMQKSRKAFVGILLFIVSVEICLAQHWSYGLQPGGKRNADNLGELFQEIANDMEKIGEVQKTECPGSYQHPQFSDLKEAMMQVFQCDTFLELIQEYYAMRGEVSGNGPPRGKNFSSYLHHFLEQLELSANKDTPS